MPAIRSWHHSLVLFLVLFLLLPAARLRAQTTPPPADTDTAAATARAVPLPAATVVGYGQRLPLRRTAAAVGVVGVAELERFSPTSITQAVNTLPGVRLEERAPASYRLSIRGSTLRSPFGVRNVKIYYFDIPFTEANGSSPLNLLDPAQLGRIEVLKGPAGSVYGAGTGGVVRLENRRPPPGRTRGQLGFMTGSYGLRRLTATAETSGGATENSGYLRVQYARQTSAGYRRNSALRRDVLTLDAETAPAENQTLAVHALYTDLKYELPGGLTRAQALTDPRQARPATRLSPGTAEQRAAYASQTGLLGLTHEYRFGPENRWTSRATIYGTGTVIKTPFLLDYERNTALGGGGRASLNYRAAVAGRPLRLTAGAEAQTSFLSSRNYQNRRGTPGPLRYDDEVRTGTGFVFAQADYELPAGLLLTTGASYNRLRYQIIRAPAAGAGTTGALPYRVARNFRPELSPRVALLKEITGNISVYTSVSAGFSPPTEAEIRPSDGSVNARLQAERGLSYELGSRGTLLNQRLTFEVALFDLRLRNTIVGRSNEQGTQLFANAGTTRQRGAELALSSWLWQPDGAGATAVTPAAAAPAGLRVWTSYAYNRFRFGRYEPLGQNFNGNRLTGTAPHTLSAGLDFAARAGFYANPTLSHQARLPLNDANTEYAAGYWVFGARAGWRRALPAGLALDVFGGLDNATDRNYSLGNDLNAFGGRYFQPAPGRSWYGGLQVARTW